MGVFSLTGWSRQIRAEFLVFRVTQDTAMLCRASCTGLSPSVVSLSKDFYSHFIYNIAVLQPRIRIATSTVWAVPRSLATTGGIIIYFLFLEVLRCFSSLGLPSGIGQSNCPSDSWVVPFGYLRINGHLHLPAAFRSLSRPSSPP